MDCYKCKETGTIFYIHPVGKYVCPSCKKEEREKEKELKEAKVNA